MHGTVTKYMHIYLNLQETKFIFPKSSLLCPQQEQVSNLLAFILTYEFSHSYSSYSILCPTKAEEGVSGCVGVYLPPGVNPSQEVYMK